MNDDRAQLAKGLISAPYIKQALEGTRSRSALLASLLSQRRLLPNGLDDFSIQMIMMELAAMDSNNFLSNAGMGEREGRVFSAIVRARCWSMSHGVGRRRVVQLRCCGSRAGVWNKIVPDAAALQWGSRCRTAQGRRQQVRKLCSRLQAFVSHRQPRPSAPHDAPSFRSLMVKLASYLALDAVRSVGVKDASQAKPPLHFGAFSPSIHCLFQNALQLACLMFCSCSSCPAPLE
jgi:hypothetical protein